MYALGTICLVLLFLSVIPPSDNAAYTYEINCSSLRMGQYICPHPDYDFIDPKTQQPKGCTKENKAKSNNCSPIYKSYWNFLNLQVYFLVLCQASEGLICSETHNNTFKKEIPCKWT